MKEKDEIRIKQVIEASLFISGSSLSAARLAKLAGCSRDEVKKIIEKLKDEYASRQSAITIEESEGKWAMEVRREFAGMLSDIAQREFDGPILRTLAVIAYRQPITQSELVKVRGKVAYQHVKEFEKRGFVESRPYGHTKMLRTTKKFREYFEIA